MGIYINGMSMPKSYQDIRIYADGRVVSRSLHMYGEQIAIATPATAERPMVQGKWIWKENGEVVCSRCNYLMAVVGNTEDFITVKSYHNFCPNCGAMMEEL